MLRILHIIPTIGRNGGCIFALNYALNMSKVHSDFLCMSVESNSFVERIKNAGGNITVIPFLSPLFFLPNLFRIIFYFITNARKYDIIHVHQSGFGFIYLFWGYLFGIRVRIAHSHSTVYSQNKLKDFLQMICAKLFINFASHYFACSNKAGAFMFGEKKWKKQGKLIPNAIEAERFFFSPKSRDDIRNELGISNHSTVILHVGIVCTIKNPFFAVDVFERYFDLNRDSFLLFCGRNDLEDSIIDYVKQKRLNKNIFFLGARNDVSRVYSTADLFLFPSLAEGLPFAVIEAQAAGLPCLLSDTITEEVKLLDTTEFLDLKSGAADWAKAISRMLGSACNKNLDSCFVKSGYEIKSAARKLSELYYNIADQNFSP